MTKLEKLKAAYFGAFVGGRGADYVIAAHRAYWVELKKTQKGRNK